MWHDLMLGRYGWCWFINELFTGSCCRCTVVVVTITTTHTTTTRVVIWCDVRLVWLMLVYQWALVVVVVVVVVCTTATRRTRTTATRVVVVMWCQAGLSGAGLSVSSSRLSASQFNDQSTPATTSSATGRFSAYSKVSSCLLSLLQAGKKVKVCM